MQTLRPFTLLFLRTSIFAAGMVGAVVSLQAEPLGPFPLRSQWKLRSSSTSGNYLFKKNHDGVLLHNGAFSYDGITFTNFTNPFRSPYVGWAGEQTTYGEGTFVKTASSHIYTSENGTKWTMRINATNNHNVGLLYGNGVFSMHGLNGTFPGIASYDGSHWYFSGFSVERGENYPDSVFGNGKSLVLKDHGVIISLDRFSWAGHSVTNVPQGFSLRNAHHFDGSFFVGAAETNRSGNSVSIVTARSHDGISWDFSEAAIPSLSTGPFVSAGAGAGYLMIVSQSNPSEVWYSADYGLSWINVDGPWAAPGNTSAFFAATGNVLAVATDFGIYSYRFTGSAESGGAYAESITPTGALLEANITSGDGSAIVERGFVFSSTAINENPLIGGAGVVKVKGFSADAIVTVGISGLLPATGYAYRAYLTTSSGTSYSGTRYFTTDTPVSIDAGIGTVTNRVIRPGETQIFALDLSRPSAAIFSGAGASPGMQWEIRNGFKNLLASGTGNLTFTRALASALPRGIYRLFVTNTGTSTETFSLNLDASTPASPLPDVSVGLDAAASLGVDLYDPPTPQQSVLAISTNASSRDVYFLIDNDGTFPDAMRISGPGRDRRFKVNYTLRKHGSKWYERLNVTAGVIAGTAVTPLIEPSASPFSLTVKIIPDRSNWDIVQRDVVNGRLVRTGYGRATFGPKALTVQAATDPTLSDTAIFQLDTVP
jgi:hypothetical protein